MKLRTRFIKSVIDTARTVDTDLPWARGTTRRGNVQRRAAAAPAKRARSA